MSINMTHLQKLRVTGSNGISKLDDGDIEVAFYDYIEEPDMMGPDDKGRLLFREIFARWQRAQRFTFVNTATTEKAYKYDELQRVLSEVLS